MELNEYQKKAMGTCMPSCENFSYMMLNLVGEVGEFAGKVAKMVRKGQVEIDTMDDKTSDLFPMTSAVGVHAGGTEEGGRRHPMAARGPLPCDGMGLGGCGETEPPEARIKAEKGCN